MFWTCLRFILFLAHSLTIQSFISCLPYTAFIEIVPFHIAFTNILVYVSTNHFLLLIYYVSVQQIDRHTNQSTRSTVVGKHTPTSTKQRQHHRRHHHHHHHQRQQQSVGNSNQSNDLCASSHNLVRYNIITPQPTYRRFVCPLLLILFFHHQHLWPRKYLESTTKKSKKKKIKQ